MQTVLWSVMVTTDRNTHKPCAFQWEHSQTNRLIIKDNILKLYLALYIETTWSVFASSSCFVMVPNNMVFFHSALLTVGNLGSFEV